MSNWQKRIRDELALARSVLTYYGDAAHAEAMDKLYAAFIRPGDLVFDIGAHVGNRVASFRRLGGRVVALEPQPGPAAVIERIFAEDRDVTLIQAACAAKAGPLQLRISSSNPTVSTASTDFITAASDASGWREQVWDRELTVEAQTLDDLIARHGQPAFVKIDVEGLEHQVIAGLSRPLSALSLEFTTIQRQVAARAIERLERLATYRYDMALGESQRMMLATPCPADEIIGLLNALPHDANSGDIYARLDT